MSSSGVAFDFYCYLRNESRKKGEPLPFFCQISQVCSARSGLSFKCSFQVTVLLFMFPCGITLIGATSFSTKVPSSLAGPFLCLWCSEDEGCFTACYEEFFGLQVASGSLAPLIIVLFLSFLAVVWDHFFRQDLFCFLHIALNLHSTVAFLYSWLEDELKWGTCDDLHCAQEKKHG